MLLAKIHARICCCVLESHASVEKSDGEFCKCPKSISLYFSLIFCTTMFWTHWETDTWTKSNYSCAERIDLNQMKQRPVHTMLVRNSAYIKWTRFATVHTMLVRCQLRVCFFPIWTLPWLLLTIFITVKMFRQTVMKFLRLRVHTAPRR